MRHLILAICLAALGACAGAQPVPEEKPAAAKADPNAFRANAPAPGQPPELVTPKFESFTLDNGLKVYVSERHDLPLVALGVAYGAGSAADPKGKAGLADITYETLLEGAGKYDALALDNAFADLGTTPSVSVAPDGAFVGVNVLTRNLDEAAALLAEVVQRPRFDAKGFDRRKKQQLADLALMAGNPRYLASEAFAATAFGADHPYGHPGAGTPKSVQSISLADAKRFYGQAAGPRATALIVTGDVDRARAEELAKAYFGKWKGTAKEAVTPKEPAVPNREQVVWVPKPGLNQTVILMGRPALPAGHPDEFTLDLASTVFGGFFGSRLNMNLREAKGYTYGATAYVDTRRGVGPLVATSAVRADVTGPALQEFMSELQGMKAEPITKDELEAAREGQIRSIPGSFETVDGLAMAAASLYWKDLPLDRYQKVIEGYEKADAAAVQQAAEKYLDPAKMQIVLVGDPQVITEQVKPLGLGTMQQRAAVVPAK